MPSAQITALENRTEGWIAGLQMAAHALQGRDAAAVQTFIDDFGDSHRYVIDYLADQVFYRQPESIQRFLTQTSVLQRFCAELCDAVIEPAAGSNTADGRAALKRLDQSNMFLVARDGQRCWYRYHHLFAEFLR